MGFAIIINSPPPLILPHPLIYLYGGVSGEGAPSYQFLWGPSGVGEGHTPNIMAAAASSIEIVAPQGRSQHWEGGREEGEREGREGDGKEVSK